MFRNLILSILSSLLFILAWPPYGFPFLIFLAFVPLLIHFCNLQSKKQIFGYSFFTFFLWNISVTYWILYASFFGMVMAVLVNSLLMAGVFTIAFWIKSSYDIKRGLWSLLCFWLSFEYLHLNWDLSWPWLTIGNVFSHYPSNIQWYEYTGILGGSLWVLVVNILVFRAFTKRQFSWSIPIFIAVPLLFSYFHDTSLQVGKEVRFLIVQPNIDPYKDKFEGLSAEEQLQKFIQLAQTQLDSTTQYLLGPETALVRGVWENHIDKSPAVIELRKLIEKHPDLTVILGATTFRMFSDTTDMPSTVRKYRNGSYYDVYNSALQITKEKVQIYHKSKLVQGVEFIPFSSVLSKLDFLTIDLGGISGSLGTQEDRAVFASSSNVAPIICYESIFGEYITDYTKNGADVFTIITNDGWWKNTPGYQQHLHYASLRAIENRREIARSANTGISAFIDVKGNVSDATQWDQQETIVKSINLYSGNTFYVVYGDYIGRVFSFLSILFLCFGIAKRRAYH
jgi:apolipoprotein N-acyltransferase